MWFKVLHHFPVWSRASRHCVNNNIPYRSFPVTKIPPMLFVIVSLTWTIQKLTCTLCSRHNVGYGVVQLHAYLIINDLGVSLPVKKIPQKDISPLKQVLTFNPITLHFQFFHWNIITQLLHRTDYESFMSHLKMIANNKSHVLSILQPTVNYSLNAARRNVISPYGRLIQEVSREFADWWWSGQLTWFFKCYKSVINYSCTCFSRTSATVLTSYNKVHGLLKTRHIYYNILYMLCNRYCLAVFTH